MMSEIVDVAVVGAGPAGARVAELLAAMGASVVLLDPRAPWEKPCGGGLTPAAFEEMPELGEIRSLARPVAGVRVEIQHRQSLGLPLEQPIWIVSRRLLGRWQLERAGAAGVLHRPVRVRTIARAGGGGWRLETPDEELRAAFLVGADGAASLVRRVVAPDFKVELEPTRVAYPGGTGPDPERATLRFYDDVAGYLWDFPRPDHRSVGIVVPESTWRRPQLDGEIDDYASRVDGGVGPSVERAGAVIGTAWHGHGDYGAIGGADFALIGDAAGLADPLTGEGIQNALRSAGLLARAWEAGDPARYPAMAAETFEDEFRRGRLLRRHLLESPRGLRLLERALASRTWYGFAWALLNAVNENDGHLGRLVLRWGKGYRRRHATA